MEFFFKHFKDYWFLVVFIGMVLVSWTTFSNRLDGVEMRVSELEKAINTFEQVRIDIAVIKNDISSIKQTLKQ